MQTFRGVLIALTLVIALYTLVAVTSEGANLLPHFFTPILALTWQGQFNLDFTSYLILSGIWMAWRGGFTGGSIALGLFAPLLGMLFLAPYLIFLIGQSDRNPRKLLLGVHAN